MRWRLTWTVLICTVASLSLLFGFDGFRTSWAMAICFLLLGIADRLEEIASPAAREETSVQESE